MGQKMIFKDFHFYNQSEELLAILDDRHGHSPQPRNMTSQEV